MQFSALVNVLIIIIICPHFHYNDNNTSDICTMKHNVQKYNIHCISKNTLDFLAVTQANIIWLLQLLAQTLLKQSKAGLFFHRNQFLSNASAQKFTKIRSCLLELQLKMSDVFYSETVVASALCHHWSSGWQWYIKFDCQSVTAAFSFSRQFLDPRLVRIICSCTWKKQMLYLGRAVILISRHTQDECRQWLTI